MNSDAELLSQFASNGDESAFRGIVERHASMVLGVAWRRTQDRALAEEITQTVFTILARKALSLRHEELAGWLHRAAFMETCNACRKEGRRREVLRELTDHMNEEPQSDAAWQDIRPHLDEAMTRLSPEERQLVVLRYFEQRSYREIADAMGKSEEASRKQMQRSLDRLGALLRKRGIATSGAALGTVLTAQSLCTAPASAAVLAAAALQAAPTLATSTILTYSFAAMTASTIVKTAAVSLILAAIPIALLWQQNSSLKREVQELRVAATTLLPSRTVPSIPQDKVSNNTAAAEPGLTTDAGKEKKPGNPLEAMAGLFNEETLVQLAEGEMKQEVARELNRLALRLGLSDEQKEKLRRFLEAKASTGMKELHQLVKSGMLTRVMKGEEGLTEADRSALASIDATKPTGPDQDEFLKTILTQEQLAEYTKAKEEKRVAAAEDSAHMKMAAIAQHVDLSADQKDRIFQTLAQKELAKPPADPNDFSNPASAIATAIPELDRSGDEAIQGILTPEQFEIYQKSRTEEEKQTKELIKTFVPWLPQDAKAEVKAER